MLLELRIHDLALVEDLVLPVAPGWTVLTGETGAGKSLLAAAVAALAGGEVPKSRVRAGSDLAWVEGVFDLSDQPALREAVAAAGVALAGDHLLVVRREIRREGRNRVLLNGLVTALAVLQRLGPRLVAVLSQDAQRRLGRPGFARELLDALTGGDTLCRETAAAWQRWRKAAGDLAAYRRRRDLARREADLWRYQLAELQAAALRPGEEAELRERAAMKRHAVSAVQALAAAWQRLGGDEIPLAGRVQAAARDLAPLAGENPRLGAVVDLLESGAAQLEEALSQLARLRETWDADPSGLDELEARLHLYQQLREKYGCDTAGLLALQQRLAADLAELAGSEDRHHDLEAAVAAAAAALQETARRLREVRRRGAAAASARLQQAIRPLAMPQLAVAFRIAPRPGSPGQEASLVLPESAGGGAIGPDGADSVTLQVRTNPGEAAGDLGEIASGGERSRFLLGATALLTAEEPPLVQLFDEIDAGVGADTAPALAATLGRVARRSQVICITHLPTLAVHGDRHWVAAKETHAGRTRLTVRPVTGSDRLAEVARLLGGGPAAREHAADLLAAAGKDRRAADAG